MLTVAKLTKKGQLTIPKKIREHLNSDIVEFSIVGEDIIIRPIKSVAGSLSSYAKKKRKTFEEEREKAWEETVRERYGEKTDRR